MKHNLYAFALVTGPLALSLLLWVNQMDFFWYSSDYRKVFDLLYSLFTLVAFLAGVRLFAGRHLPTLTLWLCIFFLVWQGINWKFDFNTPIAKLELAERQQSIMVNRSDPGAFGTAFIYLELVESRYLLFVKLTPFHRLENIRSAGLRLSDDNTSLKLDTVSYANETNTELIPLEQIPQASL